jgi:unsaturated rhamnogalacturonyl hydrolase
MKNRLFCTSLVLVAILLSHSFAASSTTWGIDFSNAIIQRWPNSINDMTNKGWEYSNGIVLQGIERVYEYTKDAQYVNYIKKYVNQFVDENGDADYDKTANSLDKLHPAIVCLFLYQETGEQKYKLAADKLFVAMKNQPVNGAGGFWHKEKYPNQMWCDGVYMALPFFVKYGYRIGEQSYCDSMAAFQTLLFSSHAYVPSKKLLLHGWDESGQASWADATTGCSPEIWCRAMGWFAMAIVEMLKYFPPDHNKYIEILTLLENIAEGIKETQDATTGLWYQVMDKGGSEGNWLESSGSGMFIYALKTAVNCGFLDASYLSVAQEGWEGLKTKISLDNEGLPVINDFVGGMGIQNNYDAYINQTVVSCPPAAHPHGYCGVLMASSAMELADKRKFRLTVSTEGEGSVINPTGEMFHDSGTTVTLTAVPASGHRLDAWGGDGSGSDMTTAILMDGEKSVTATFVSGSTVVSSMSKKAGSRISIKYSGKSANIICHLETAREIDLSLFASDGRRVCSIVKGFYGPGSYTFTTNARQVSSGAYVIRMQSGAAVRTLPFVMVADN